ncbi:patatin-like phospholipase family protein [uncultured Tateyamaria sp.]|uniref:patatin-like phospholipase family protein n=1 Tax=uncultured Tateyamaria sp. TaxID=455651 RepID=UPI00260920C9|nr:patatin-like phospholipase family protein [uncultured Tateyamaria sp.]
MTEPDRPVSLLDRRTLILGASALSVTACAGQVPSLDELPDPNAPDPLARYRLSTSDDADAWMRHLDPSRMRGGPDMLALSGGGEDGAFGAGALNGWTSHGSRPEFDLVTGISTGALIAPFAFAGPEHDTALKQIFTQHGPDDILRLRGLRGLLNDSLYDVKPMANLIAKYTSADVLNAVAARHAEGARLFVVTSNLDTGKGTVWNMGALASDGQYELFREVMRASSALPGLFPPVTLQYGTEGRTVRETHIDGGVNMQLLAVPPAAFSGPARRGNGGHLYVVINNTLDPSPQPVARNVMSISQRALTTMIRSSAAETVRSARLFSQQSDLDLSVASIAQESGITFDPGARFDQQYMQQLFAHGYDRAARGALWGNLPNTI